MSIMLNLKVLILEADYFARRAINSFLAWDRRTRVVALAEDLDQALAYINSVGRAEFPDIILLDSDVFVTSTDLENAIQHFRLAVPNVMVICLARQLDKQRVQAALAFGARGYLLRNEVGQRIAGAVCYAIKREFVITESVRGALVDASKASLIPPERLYPMLKERVRQALSLCVLEGMPADLAADEMGVSPHTVRSYVKEGYRILEANDSTNYPDDMSPLERAFMRFTALQGE